ncbi:odorant receptor 187 [Tribolium castaneum]|uniref:Odorant receptor 187 n=1 Tax=Tribolium castaneum TaxID=7070 RepID=D6X4X8_TRICA|nr:odorant receptor 187 [Tribolium castaneum]
MSTKREVVKNFPYYYLFKICIDFGYSNVVKRLNICCITMIVMFHLTQIHYMQENFSKELILKYGSGIALGIYTILSMSVQMLIEHEIKDLIAEALFSMWAVDSCGPQVEKLILRRAKVMNIIYCSIFAWFALMATVMLPMWGDHSEWLLYDPILVEDVKTRLKIIYYLSTFIIFPMIAFSAIRLPGILLYGILQIHMQIMLINHKLVQVSEDLDDLNNVKKIDQDDYQERIYKELCLCVEHHIKIKLYVKSGLYASK